MDIVNILCFHKILTGIMSNMSIINTLSFQDLQRLRKFVQMEHKRTFGVELPQTQVDQFIESYWGEYMENELEKAVNLGTLH